MQLQKEKKKKKNPLKQLNCAAGYFIIPLLPDASRSFSKKTIASVQKSSNKGVFGEGVR